MASDVLRTHEWTLGANTKRAKSFVDLLLQTFWKVEHNQNRVYHIDYKVDAHYI